MKLCVDNDWLRLQIKNDPMENEMDIYFKGIPPEKLQLVVDLAKRHLYKYTPVLPIDLGDCFQKHVLVNESASIEICSGTDLLFIKWIPDDL